MIATKSPKKRRAPVMGVEVPYPKPKANARLQAWVLDADGDLKEMASSLQQLMSTWTGPSFDVMGLTGTQAKTIKTRALAGVHYEPARWPNPWQGAGLDVLAPSTVDAERWMGSAIKAAQTHMRRRYPHATVLFMVRYYRPSPGADSCLADVQLSLPKRNGRFWYETERLTGQQMWARGILFAKWFEQWPTARVMGLMLEEVVERSELKGELEAVLAQTRSRQLSALLEPQLETLPHSPPAYTRPRL